MELRDNAPIWSLLCRLPALAEATSVVLRRRRRRHKKILSHFSRKPQRPAS